MSKLDQIRNQAEHDHIKRLNVAAIIVNLENKILFCQRSLQKKVAPGAWHMPGGKVEDGESIEQAIARELKEELDLTVVDVGGYSGVYHDYAPGGESHRTVFVYVKAEGTPQLNPENDTYKYLTLEEIPQYLEPHVTAFNLTAAEYGQAYEIK